MMRDTVVDVDLDAIAANLDAIQRAAGVPAIAVVKADAYGHGAEAVSRALLDAGAALLAVFTVEEGVALRRTIADAPILVLLGATDASEIDAAISARLTLSVWDVEEARAIAEAARAAHAVVPLHFKIDTGLTRLGAPQEEAVARYRAIAALPGVAVEGVYSHLANADEPDDRTSATQIESFRKFVSAMGRAPRWVHLAASAGVESIGPLAFCTAIRPGLALYGIHTAPHLAGSFTLRPALSWRSAVRRIASVPAGTGVSYGHEYHAPRATRIATVAVGYGDGLPRAGTGRLGLLLGGARVPIVGRVCMDLVMLDVGERAVALGDEVVIVGEQRSAKQTADDVAAACRTISYEIVTNIHARVPRRYRRGGRVVATKTLADGFAWC